MLPGGLTLIEQMGVTTEENGEDSGDFFLSTPNASSLLHFSAQTDSSRSCYVSSPESQISPPTPTSAVSSPFSPKPFLTWWWRV